MSVDQILADSDDKSVEEMVRQLATRVTELEAQNEALKDRVEELESQPTFIWDSTDFSDLKIVNPEAGFELPMGKTIKSKVSTKELEDHDAIQAIRDDVEAVKRGEVSGADLVGSVDPHLPIEESVAKAGDETLKSDLSANELRAVHVFRKFGSRADSWSGTMTVQSSDVKQIIEEAEGSKPNPNTVKRTMRMLAKKTSDQPKGDRDHADKEHNLIYTAKGDRRLQLKADKSEWLDYMEEVENRYSS